MLTDRAFLEVYKKKPERGECKEQVEDAHFYQLHRFPRYLFEIHRFSGF